MVKVYAGGALAVAAIVATDLWIDFDYALAANIALLYMSILVTVFTVLYGLRSRWGANPIGRTFFTKCIFMSLVLWQATVSVWTNSDYPHRDVIRFAVYSAGVVTYIPMLVSLWREQHRDRTQRDMGSKALSPDVGD